MSDPPTIIAELLLQIVNAESMVAGARRAHELLERESQSILADAKDASGAILQFLRSSGVPTGAITPEEFQDHILRHQSSSLAAVIDSASLIATHALLDTVIHRLLQVVIRATPEKCEHFVTSRSVELSIVRDTPYSAILAEKLARFESSIERAPLLEKLDRLMSVLRPVAGSLDTESHRFSRDRIERLNNLRHDIVHRGGLRILPTLEDDLQYVQYVLHALWATTATSAPGLLSKLAEGKPPPP